MSYLLVMFLCICGPYGAAILKWYAGVRTEACDSTYKCIRYASKSSLLLTRIKIGLLSISSVPFYFGLRWKISGLLNNSSILAVGADYFCYLWSFKSAKIAVYCDFTIMVWSERCRHSLMYLWTKHQVKARRLKRMKSWMLEQLRYDSCP